MSLTGIHISNFELIPDIHKEHNIKFFQFFVTPSKNYKKEYPKIIKYIKKNNISCIVHSSYSINLARTWNTSSWQIQHLIGEIIICNQIGITNIVIHTGKSLNLPISTAINNMYTSLLYIHQQTIKYKNVKILLETPSGQGTELLTDIKDFCKFINKFSSHPDNIVKSRFNICFDTCHVYAAGYDISKHSIIDKLIMYLNENAGINKIKLIHINDSKMDMNSRRDRHENIGHGKIGKNNIIKLIKFFHKLEIPMILETPSKYIMKDYQIISNT